MITRYYQVPRTNSRKNRFYLYEAVHCTGDQQCSKEVLTGQPYDQLANSYFCGRRQGFSILGSVHIRIGKIFSDHPISHIGPIYMNSEARTYVIVTKSYSDIIASFTVGAITGWLFQSFCMKIYIQSITHKQVINTLFERPLSDFFV